jgi:hypothetical protein
VGVLGNPLHFEIDRDLSPHSVQNIQPVIKNGGNTKRRSKVFSEIIANAILTLMEY